MGQRLSTLFLAWFLFIGASEQQALNIISSNGGLNTRAGALTVENNQATDLQNVHFTTTGSILKRRGNNKFGDTLGAADEVTLLADYRLVSGTSKIVAASGAVVYKTDGTGDGVWDDITSGETVTADSTFDFDQFRDLLLFTNGTDLPFKWDATGSPSDIAQMGVPTNLTKAKHIAVWNDYTFLCNVTVSSTDHPSRCYYTNAGTADTFTATDFIHLGRDKGEGEISLVEPLGDRLVIGKQYGAIYNVFFTGDSDLPFISQKSFSQVGSGADYANVVVNNVLFFWSTDGLGFYAYDGQNSIKISENITPTLEDYASSRFANIIGKTYPKLNQIWWLMTSTGSTHDTIVVFDYQNKAWTIYKGIAASYITTVQNGGVLDLYTGNYAGVLAKQDISNTDINSAGTDGQDIVSFFYTKWFDMGAPYMKKSIDHLIVYNTIEGEWNVDVAVGYDFADSDSVTLALSLSGGGVLWGAQNWGAFNWSTTGGGATSRMDFKGRGRVCRFHFSNNNADEPFEIVGYSIIYKNETIF